MNRVADGVMMYGDGYGDTLWGDQGAMASFEQTCRAPAQTFRNGDGVGLPDVSYQEGEE